MEHTNKTNKHVMYVLKSLSRFYFLQCRTKYICLESARRDLQNDVKSW